MGPFSIQKKISPRNRAALAAAQAQGVKVVLTTGRPLESHGFSFGRIKQQASKKSIRLPSTVA